MAGCFSPSEKYELVSSSVGMMTFPTEWKKSSIRVPNQPALRFKDQGVGLKKMKAKPGDLPGLVNIHTLRHRKWPSRNSGFTHEKW